MALYLCRMDVENTYKDGEPKLIACIGALIDVDGGYRFIPWSSKHKPSRRVHADINKAIPKWADEKYQGYTRLLNHVELEKAKLSTSVK